jgi:hypothetical protein
MSVRKFLTVRRRVVGCCWTLLALAILAAPSLSWAQTCNAVVDITSAPAKAGWVDGGAADRYWQLGEVATVTLEVGAGSIGGLPLLVEQFRAALDCQQSDVVSREQCLGYAPFTPSGAAPPNDGLTDIDAIEYLGNLSVTGAACAGSQISLADLTTPRNVLAFDAVPAITFENDERCFISFDVQFNTFGLALDANPSRPGVQLLNQAGGFDGACAETVDGEPSASGRNSIQYQFRSTPLIQIVKEVSVDGGPWLSFVGDATYPTATGEYRLLVTNPASTVDPITGAVVGEPLENVVLNDLTLGLTNVPLPDRCYVDGVFPSGATCTITSGDAGFDAQYANLGGVDVCQNFPGSYINTACTEGDGVPSGVTAGPVCDTAEVLCVGEPDIEIIKRVWDPASSTWVDANDPPGPTYPVGAVVSYQLEVCNIGDLDLDNVEVFDPTLNIPPTSIGPLAVGECEILEEGIGPVTGLDTTDPCSEQRQFENIAYADGFPIGGLDPVQDNDPANVICVPPELRVTKDGDPESKAGDTVSYDVCAYNDSPTVALAACEATDTLPGVTLPAPFDLAAGASFCWSYDYMIPVDFTGTQLDNTATVDCNVVGVDPASVAGSISASDNWTVDLFELDGYMVKTCDPDPVMVDEDICWNITVFNTGDKDFDCTITDPTVPGWNPIDLPGTVAPGGSQSLAEVCRRQRCTTSGYSYPRRIPKPRRSMQNG